MKPNILYSKTKIIATVGPSCNELDQLWELAKAGVNVFRLNFSHGSYDQHLEVINNVRTLNKEHQTHLSLLQDLQGPKIRIGEVENGEVTIQSGQTMLITTDPVLGTKDMISTNYESLPYDVTIGEMILIDDGKIELKVTGTEGNRIITQVIHGGHLKSRKGINLPSTAISAPSLTPKDLDDLAFGLEQNVDWVALSFVRSSEDIIKLKGIIEKSGKSTKVIAKIEKPEAIKNIDGIIEQTDAIMVARGDLGVEILMEDVPMAQKLIVSKCNRASKPVIIATQMMESMISNPRPTRAETNDIANAVMDGADALMLSAETAVGKYPILTIKSMSKTILSVEKSDQIYFKHDLIDPDSPTFYSDNIIRTACHLAQETNAKTLVGMTKSGYTGFRLSSHRPQADIFIFTDNLTLLNQMSLIWGVRGIYYDRVESTDATISDIELLLKDRGHVRPGDVFINLASMPIHEKNRTNMLKINLVK